MWWFCMINKFIQWVVIMINLLFFLEKSNLGKIDIVKKALGLHSFKFSQANCRSETFNLKPKSMKIAKYFLSSSHLNEQRQKWGNLYFSSWRLCLWLKFLYYYYFLSDLFMVWFSCLSGLLTQKVKARLWKTAGLKKYSLPPRYKLYFIF